ncbi:MAG TPA: protoporphyrinogen oxidase, partial [Nitrospirota bacterium]|nr:protoporphyrinogen oxidase [Nitrospirota bacterium]
IGRDSIRTGAGVKAIERRNSGYTVVLDNNEKLEADHVMLASASYESAGIVKGLDPELAGKMEAIPWSSSATVSLSFRKEDVKVPLRGFGFIVPRIEGRKINAATYSSIKWSYRAPDNTVMVRVFVGGGHHEELVQDLDDAGMVKLVLEELDGILGLKADARFSRIYRWHRGMPKYTVGHLDRIAMLDRVLEGHPGLHLIGCSYKGIGIGDCVHEAQVAAEKILRS